LSFADVFGSRKLESLACGVVCMILRLSVSIEHRLLTDRQTDRRTTPIYNALAWRLAVKTVQHLVKLGATGHFFDSKWPLFRGFAPPCI